MKFKPRLPLSGNPLQPSTDLAEMSGDEPIVASPPPSQGIEKGDGEALAGAFEAVAQVVRREIESLKRSVVGLESQLMRRIESERESLGTAMSELRQELTSRMNELRDHQQKALVDFGEQSKASIVSLRGQVEQARQLATTRAEEIKVGLEQILSAKEQRLEKELDTLSHRFSGLRVDLEQQVASAGRVSTLLNDIAQVFSDPKALPQTPPRSNPTGA